MGKKTWYPILPQDTAITHYFWYGRNIMWRRAFGVMALPDGRFMLHINHFWGDGEEMNFDFEFADGIRRTGLNPLHIVRIYDRIVTNRTMRKDISKFLKKYGKMNAMPENQEKTVRTPDEYSVPDVDPPILGTSATTKQKPCYILSKYTTFDRSIIFSDKAGTIYRGAWGRRIIDKNSNNVQVGFKTGNVKYSWGRQLDGGYVESTIHDLEYLEWLKMNQESYKNCIEESGV